MKKIKTLLVAALFASLSACGGGGGDEPVTPAQVTERIVRQTDQYCETKGKTAEAVRTSEFVMDATCGDGSNVTLKFDSEGYLKETIVVPRIRVGGVIRPE